MFEEQESTVLIIFLIIINILINHVLINNFYDPFLEPDQN